MALSRTSHDLHSDAEMGTAVTAALDYPIWRVSRSPVEAINGHHDLRDFALMRLPMRSLRACNAACFKPSSDHKCSPRQPTTVRCTNLYASGLAHLGGQLCTLSDEFLFPGAPASLAPT